MSLRRNDAGEIPYGRDPLQRLWPACRFIAALSFRLLRSGLKLRLHDSAKVLEGSVPRRLLVMNLSVRISWPIMGVPRHSRMDLPRRAGPRSRGTAAVAGPAAPRPLLSEPEEHASAFLGLGVIDDGPKPALSWSAMRAISARRQSSDARKSSLELDRSATSKAGRKRHERVASLEDADYRRFLLGPEPLDAERPARRPPVHIEQAHDMASQTKRRQPN